MMEQAGKDHPETEAFYFNDDNFLSLGKQNILEFCNLTNKLDKTVILEQKQEIILLFQAIWKYIALFNFKQDLRSYYSESILKIHFELDILQQENELIDRGTELQSLIPEDIITDPLKKKLHDALSQIKIISPEEREKQKENMKKLKKELGDEEFQKHLLNKLS